MHAPMRMAGWLAALGSTLAIAAGAEPPFELIDLPAPGRTAFAGFADLDGDGRTDVFSVGLSGVPPTDRRVLRIHFQTREGRLPGVPGWSGEVPRIIFGSSADYGRQLDRLGYILEYVRNQGNPSIERIDLSLRGSAAVQFSSGRVGTF